MKIKEFFYLIYYSIKSLFTDIIELIAELKNPKTWSWILVAFLFVAFYYRRFDLMWYIAPFIILVKLIRDKIEGRYKHELFKKTLTKDKDTDLVVSYYKKYRRECEHSGKKPMDYHEWKILELQKHEFD